MASSSGTTVQLNMAGADLARKILRRLFRDFEGNLRIVLWDGSGLNLGDGRPEFTLLRRHYALTLREWVRRLELRHEEALEYVPESVYRIWRFYMVTCAVQFEEGNTGVYQILVPKRKPFSNPVPLTRRDLYGGDAGGMATASRFSWKASMPADKAQA